jgi:hypothetical protein
LLKKQQADTNEERTETKRVLGLLPGEEVE